MRSLLMCFSLFYFLAIAASVAIAGIGDPQEHNDEDQEFILYDNYTDEVITYLINTDAIKLFNIIHDAIRESTELKLHLHSYIPTILSSLADDIATHQKLSNTYGNGNGNGNSTLNHNSKLMEYLDVRPASEDYHNLNIIAHMITNLQTIPVFSSMDCTNNILNILKHILNMSPMTTLLHKIKWDNKQILTRNTINLSFSTIKFVYAGENENENENIDTLDNIYAMEMPLVDNKQLYMSDFQTQLSINHNETDTHELYCRYLYPRTMAIVFEESKSIDKPADPVELLKIYKRPFSHHYIDTETKRLQPSLVHHNTCITIYITNSPLTLCATDEDTLNKDELSKIKTTLKKNKSHLEKMILKDWEFLSKHYKWDSN
ncbi:MAG: hypothetical protein QS748_04080 [Candidatus Endonucleobacter bathymodioli]|uniref:Uncharacterized protein n=1 Tax=Candidatus Endonucleibacter bathymodioli TaxID=539814 RepID=A0AA90NXC4_9GAMM|nr:hypothetical protein [Candidatus Endonucleobacter bathymodioli]